MGVGGCVRRWGSTRAGGEEARCPSCRRPQAARKRRATRGACRPPSPPARSPSLCCDQPGAGKIAWPPRTGARGDAVRVKPRAWVRRRLAAPHRRLHRLLRFARCGRGIRQWAARSGTSGHGAGSAAQVVLVGQQEAPATLPSCLQPCTAAQQWASGPAPTRFEAARALLVHLGTRRGAVDCHEEQLLRDGAAQRRRQARANAQRDCGSLDADACTTAPCCQRLHAEIAFIAPACPAN